MTPGWWAFIIVAGSLFALLGFVVAGATLAVRGGESDREMRSIRANHGHLHHRGDR